jgi:iron complex transport system substrate-binding protein
VWARPLLTVNGRHIISDVVGLCGGRNLFAALSPLVPPVSVEAVIEADPEAIITTSNDATPRGDEGLEIWRALPKLRATARGNLVALRAETIHRQSPRILDGAADLCERLEEVRARRPR